jgi:hypothetical protein
MSSPIIPVTYQSKEVRDFLRLYGPYLAEQIDVWCPGRNRFGRLCGLPFVQGHESPFADVLLYATEDERREEILVDAPEAITNLRPVLYAFEDLASEIVLADGRRVVPAVEVAKLWHSGVDDAHFIENYEGGGLTCVCRGPGCELSISKAGFETARLGHWLAELLRQHHFAVGLRPEQYRRKAVGAASPCGAGCAGCEKGKEVGHA